MGEVGRIKKYTTPPHVRSPANGENAGVINVGPKGGPRTPRWSQLTKGVFDRVMVILGWVPGYPRSIPRAVYILYQTHPNCRLTYANYVNNYNNKKLPKSAPVDTCYIYVSRMYYICYVRPVQNSKNVDCACTQHHNRARAT